MSVLFLSESDVEKLVDIRLAIDVMEAAFRGVAAHPGSNVPRARARGQGLVLHSMSAVADELGLAGWKQYTTTRTGAIFHVGLYDQSTGRLVALIEADRLGQLRTGAVTGLAARLLANPGADEVGLFGTGWQAESQLAAVASSLPIRRARVYGRDRDRRAAFADRMSKKLQIEVVACDAPRQAVDSLPIVVTATTSKTPVFEGRWLAPGTLVCAIGSNWPQKAEVDLETVRRAEAVVCDSVACCQGEAGDLLQAVEAGAFSWTEARELADVVTGKVNRPGENSIVVFKSVGMAIEDVYLGGKVLELARQQGSGRTLEL